MQKPKAGPHTDAHVPSSCSPFKGIRAAHRSGPAPAARDPADPPVQFIIFSINIFVNSCLFTNSLALIFDS
jgi:hypothetical protein